jgi:protein-disulfide isomerase
VLFLGVDTQDVTSDARTFVRDHAIDYPNILASEDVARGYGAIRVPQTFFIDRRGQIVGHVSGASSVGQLVDGITAAVAGRVRGPRHGAQATGAAVSSLLAGIRQRGNTLGDPKAPVTVQYFGDLQCPACKQFTLHGLPSLIESYVRSGKLKIEYRSLETATRNVEVFKLQQIAALAAGEQNKLWDFIELFYHEQGPEHSGYVTESYLQGLAQQVRGLHLIEWSAGRNDPQLARAVASDARTAASAGVSSTPTFLIVTMGPRPPYVAAIEKQLRGLPSSSAGG